MYFTNDKFQCQCFATENTFISEIRSDVTIEPSQLFTQYMFDVYFLFDFCLVKAQSHEIN